MKLKLKACQLAGVAALSALVYMPHASAGINVPTPPSGYNFTLFNTSSGTFTDTWNFSVNSDAIFSFLGSSNATVGTGNLAFLSNGATLSSVSLLDTTLGTTIDTTLNSSTTFTAGSGANTYQQTTYQATLGGINVNAADNYQLVFKGFSEISNSSVGGTIFLSSALSFPAAPIPIPSVVWLFLTGLLGVHGLNRRTK